MWQIWIIWRTRVYWFRSLGYNLNFKKFGLTILKLWTEKNIRNTSTSCGFQPYFCTYAHIRPKNKLYLDKKDFVRYLHVREERVRNLAIFKRNINFYHIDKKRIKSQNLILQSVYLGNLEI